MPNYGKENMNLMRIWSIDSDEIQNTDSYIFYENNHIKQFLSKENSKYTIIGARGTGKTLLLKEKRRRMELLGALCIPSDKLLDNLRSFQNFNAVDLNFDNWIDIWKLSISISVLINFKKYKPNLYEDFFEIKNYIYTNILNSGLTTPCEFFAYFSSVGSNYGLTPSEFKELMSIYDIEIFPRFSRIKDIKIAVFIDGIEQAINEIFDYNKLEWYHIQLALLNATFDLKKANKNIDIYSSINLYALRQIGLLKELQQQILSTTYLLSFNDDELRKMFNFYIIAEKNKNLLNTEVDKKSSPTKAFFGTEYINLPSKQTEEVLSFILEHTLKRPRDLIQICSNFVEKRETNNFNDIELAETIYSIVQDTSKLAINEYLNEIQKLGVSLNVSVFNQCINNKIIKNQEINNICLMYNSMLTHDELGVTEKCNEDCMNCTITRNPLLILYNIGLLGTETEDFGKTVHKFRNPTEITSFDLILPYSNFYILHPSWPVDDQQHNIKNN